MADRLEQFPLIVGLLGCGEEVLAFSWGEGGKKFADLAAFERMPQLGVACGSAFDDLPRMSAPTQTANPENPSLARRIEPQLGKVRSVILERHLDRDFHGDLRRTPVLNDIHKLSQEHASPSEWIARFG